ncbi:amidohydrolase family protein [uncultured Alsobacter sp.]|uniref:N-acetylglucosamine-6-phosphate deacetylase n=1 Tax=uncultured Alsobacter sp. TaxID=1748258 RepID=UPI0025E4CA54|nr:amidohydrolase family protein [uncultured Alsobacter sp.]
MALTAIDGRDPATGRSLRVRIEDGLIAAIEPGQDASEAWLAPGLVDLQVNGWGGQDLNAPGLTADRVASFVRSVLATGTTTMLPTLITASEESLTASLAAIASARAGDPVVARAVPSVHVEGPHISPNDGPRGAHPREHVIPPDTGLFDRLQRVAGGLIKVVTLSPHWEGTGAFVRHLAGCGVHVAIGHSDAPPEAIAAAADAGAVLSTHLGNGIAATLPRHPNLIWAQLAEDRLSASFIADGHHLPGDTLKAMLRAKGLGRSLLVSDATALGGMPPGVYRQPIGGEVELTPDGRLGVRGTPYLAGAARSLADGVATVAGIVGLADAIRLATVNPARHAGQGGFLAVGQPADLIRFRWAPGDASLSLDTVLSGGQEP